MAKRNPCSYRFRKRCVQTCSGIFLVTNFNNKSFRTLNMKNTLLLSSLLQASSLHLSPKLQTLFPPRMTTTKLSNSKSLKMLSLKQVPSNLPQTTNSLSVPAEEKSGRSITPSPRILPKMPSGLAMPMAYTKFLD